MFLSILNKKKSTLLLLFCASALLAFIPEKPARADRCHDKFPKWYQEPDRIRCRAEQSNNYETNKFDLKAQVEEGGWTVSWADDVAEKDVALGLVAAGVSVFDGGGSFSVWVENLVRRTTTSLSSNLANSSVAEAEKMTQKIIAEAIKGKLSLIHI